MEREAADARPPKEVSYGATAPDVEMQILRRGGGHQHQGGDKPQFPPLVPHPTHLDPQEEEEGGRTQKDVPQLGLLRGTTLILLPNSGISG